MSRTINESDDSMLSKDPKSPLGDEGNSGGITNGAGVLKKGPWTSAEDAILIDYVKKHGEGNWNAVQKHSGLYRCGKSCRLRWANHLRPNLKKGAFTPEEERLIIELHAKMGNKWARMAAHLPGRTDNEIKNYWNTRVKRRHRAGLPLYPPEVCLQALHKSQRSQTSCGTSGGGQGHLDLMQHGYEIPSVPFDSLKAYQGILPCVPEFPDVSADDMLMKGIGSSQYYSFMPPTTHRQKRLRESIDALSDFDGSITSGLQSLNQSQNTCDKIVRSFGLTFPYDPDPTAKNPLPSGATQGGHSLSNGNFSASKPDLGPLKSELPSLQYPETDLGSWGTPSPPPLLELVDTFIQSPPGTGTVQIDCVSPHNSGLLDELIHESKMLCSTKIQSSDKSSSSSTFASGDAADSSTLNMCEREWNANGDPVSPQGHSTALLIFNDSTPISVSGRPADEHPPAETFTGSSVKSEPVDHFFTSEEERKKIFTDLNASRPDALLASDWFGCSTLCVKDQVIMTDAIAALLGDDFSSNYKDMVAETHTSSQGWGLGSCEWSNMPAVCQMSELP